MGMSKNKQVNDLTGLLNAILAEQDEDYGDNHECDNCGACRETYDSKKINLYRATGVIEDDQPAQMIIAAPDLTIAVHVANNRLDTLKSVELVGSIDHDKAKGVLLIG